MIIGFAEGQSRSVPDVTLAVVDLPYAVARRLLRDHHPATRSQVAALRRAVRLLLDVTAGRERQ